MAPNHRCLFGRLPGRLLGLARLAVLASAAGAGCKTKLPPVTMAEGFERTELGNDWLDTGGAASQARVAEGKLQVSHGYNHPLWWKKPLPANAIIELDATSMSPDGDLKLELYGDGRSFDPDRGSYFPTGYVFIFGGWQNRLSIIGRLGEHDAGVMVKRSEPPVVPGKTYHFTITRQGGDLDWAIDGERFLSYRDPEPLAGDQHAYLGITNWEANVIFDNIQIRALP